MKTIFKYYSLLLLSCLLSSGTLRAQAQHWQYDPYAWEYDMTAYVTLTLNNKAVDNLADYEIAAFCGTECRGIATIQSSEKDGQTTVYGYLRIRSNQQAGETITFKAYNSISDKEYGVENYSLSFQSQEVIGLPSTPLILAIVTPIPGDANGDGRVTVTDIGIVVNMILQQPVSDYQEEGADANGDSKVTVTDIGAIVDLILGAGSQNARKNDDIKD